MTLPSGTRLGPYEVLASLGAGGMGEVYRARDRKLDRDVAIKVLPQSVAADPDTLSRFEREAKAVAALSHPNILSIFDFPVRWPRAFIDFFFVRTLASLPSAEHSDREASR